MSNKIFVEKSCLDLPRVQTYLKKYPNAAIVECDHYKEVFDPKANQNFRLQKRDPAMIIATKQGKRIHETPESFGLGSQQNFYFSHVLNCPFDCRYCFLQGMYSSANFVWFVNYEDFMTDIKALIAKHNQPYFFSGYDGDSLALENKTAFLDAFLPFFAAHPKGMLELRTKSAQVSRLLKYSATQNVICAFSLSPQIVIDKLEDRCASLQQRIKAMQACAEHGWPIGLRFDPIIYFDGFLEHYQSMIAKILAVIPIDAIHSVSLGPLRFPKGYFKKIKAMYPTEPLFAQAFELHGSTLSYSKTVEQQLSQAVLDPLQQHGLPTHKLFRCYT